jgi:hypothetical protein
MLSNGVTFRHTMKLCKKRLFSSPETVEEFHYQVYHRESNLTISSSPVTKIMHSLLLGVLLPCEKKEEISSTAPGLGVMAHRECRCDHPFPVT